MVRDQRRHRRQRSRPARSASTPSTHLRLILDTIPGAGQHRHAGRRDRVRQPSHARLLRRDAPGTPRTGARSCIRTTCRWWKRSGRIRWRRASRSSRSTASVGPTARIAGFIATWWPPHGPTARSSAGTTCSRTSTTASMPKSGSATSEGELRTIVDSIPGLVAIVAPSGEIEMVNRGVLDYFGRTLEELQHWRMSDSVHPEDLPSVVERWQHAIDTGDPRSGRSGCGARTASTAGSNCAAFPGARERARPGVGTA